MSAPARFARRLAAAGAALLVPLALAAPAPAAAPPPCGGVAQIIDTGGGHHPGTDALSAWFSEANGRLQAVIQVQTGTWLPEHEDEAVDVAGYAVLFEVGGRTAYVRVEVTPTGAASYDYGSFDGARFQREGATAGELVYAAYGGTATIDVPAATGAVPGAVLARPFALTYDGTSADGLPHWVDQAPGFDKPSDPARGTDFRVGSCTGGQPSGSTVIAVELNAPNRVRGGGTVQVTGRVVPALAGVAVELTRRDRGATVLRTVTGADGGFALRVPVRESAELKAVAAGVSSATVGVSVASSVRIGLRKLRSGAVRVFGRVQPALPGRLLLLGADEVAPTAAKAAGKRRFVFRFGAGRLEPGRYQVVYVPAGGRAERSTSNTVTLR
jgi:hypothetical protein